MNGYLDERHERRERRRGGSDGGVRSTLEMVGTRHTGVTVKAPIGGRWCRLASAWPGKDAGFEREVQG
jgi:hypothetical protein